MARIAELLGCPLKTAFSRLYAARREIRAELQRAGYACVPWTLLALRPWRAHAAPSLRAALEAFGAPTGAGAGASVVATGGGALARVRGRDCAGGGARRRCRSWWRGRPHDPVMAVADSGRMVAVTVPDSDSDSEPVPVPVPVPDSESQPAPAPTPYTCAFPTPAPVKRVPVIRRPPRTAAAAPAPPAPASDWIRAPEPARASPAAPSAPRTAVGLDEALEATSIDGLMRFTPSQGPRRPIALVPPRGRVQRGRAVIAHLLPVVAEFIAPVLAVERPEHVLGVDLHRTAAGVRYGRLAAERAAFVVEHLDLDRVGLVRARLQLVEQPLRARESAVRSRAPARTRARRRDPAGCARRARSAVAPRARARAPAVPLRSGRCRRAHATTRDRRARAAAPRSARATARLSVPLRSSLSRRSAASRSSGCSPDAARSSSTRSSSRSGS